VASRDLVRPNPEDLLRRIEAQEAEAARGRLKIFLGYAPRVGKSVRMFDEGCRRRKRGQDVVIGAVQPGSDEAIRMAAELEIIPPLIVSGEDVVDVEAILRRKPGVCLMDALARANPPGSRHEHRWQDAEEIRAHGINVVGALNIQHIGEQQDLVERITGRRAASSLPQSFVESADELVLVDVPAEQLTPAAANSLSAAQLSELREAALLLAAQVVEHQLQHYMDSHGIVQSWGTQERILVCVTPQPHARAMIESGARAAARFHGQLLVVTVRNRDLDRAAAETLAANLDYARRLSAEVHELESTDPIGAIIRFAREQRITQIFVGHTRQSNWLFWKTSTVDRLINAAEGMDVRIFPPPAAAPMTKGAK
jgi:two-component system, OmpR family, sensor histidine kinase KdpD